MRCAPWYETDGANMSQLVGTREAILVAATDLIHASSYNAVSVDDVCARAGSRKGSFYHFFGSKKLLALAVIERQRRGCLDYLLEPRSTAQRSPEQRVARVFHRFFRNQQAEKKSGGHVLGCLFGNLSLEMGTQDADIRRAARLVFDECAAYFAVAGGGGARGKRIGLTLVAYLEGVALMAKSHDDPRIVKQCQDGALLLLASRNPR